MLFAAPVRAQGFEDSVAPPLDGLATEPETAPPSSLPDTVDLSGQFDPELREQGSVQACHAFAAVALLEAAHFRSTGERLRLSEADLFFRSRPLKEGGVMRADLRYALKHGVLPGDAYVYDAMLARYLARGGRPRRALDFPESLSEEARAKREDVRRKLEALTIDGTDGLVYFGSAARTLAARRAVSCLGRGRRRDTIMSVLASGVPVGAGILLNGVADPGLRGDVPDDLGGAHYIVLTGYEKTPAGVTFSIRNSWGRRPGSAARLIEPDLCALFGLTWVLVP